MTNNGTGTAAAGWSDGVYLSGKTTLDSTALQLGNFRFSNSNDSDLPATLAPGQLHPDRDRDDPEHGPSARRTSLS